MTLHSAIYAGKVTHRRLRPRKHALAYRVFWLLLDLDEAETLSKRLRLFSLDRFNFFSFHRRDHGDGSDTPLRTQVERHLADAGIEAGGPIRLLCMPRILGYGFNPLSVYFCHRRDGGLAAILYQVHNTFGERHSYLIAVTEQTDGVIRQQADKAFYVSPFIDMAMRYAFTASEPGARMSIAIRVDSADDPVLLATMAGERRALNDRALAALLVTYPLLTLKVVAGIHVEAVKLWWKGVALQPRPKAPDWPVTVVRARSAGV